jgi:hypothetical protein
MSGETAEETAGEERDAPVVTDWLRRVVRGDEDPRIRATYRALLAVPLVTMLLTPLSAVLAAVLVPSGMPKVAVMATTGVLQAALVAGLLVGWARYLDRRPVADYGLSASPRWALDVGVASGAVLVGHVVWLGLGSALGWTEVTVASATVDGSLALGLLGLLVAIGLTCGSRRRCSSPSRCGTPPRGSRPGGSLPDGPCWLAGCSPRCCSRGSTAVLGWARG